jgi:capsular exopolysaccharide synthesis family protein
MSRLFEALQQSTITATEPDFAEAISTLRGFGVTSSAPPRVCPLPRNGSKRLVALVDAGCSGAERFRVLATRLQQMKDAKKFKTLVVTSCVRHEGKSLVTANVALSMAAAGERVLLIDGDLRQPTLEDLFQLKTPTGIAEWGGEGSISQYLYHFEGLPLWFLAAGRPPAHPLEALNTQRIASLLSQTSESFDWILIDSPPVIPFADTSLWTAACDRIIFVAREGVTPRRLLKRAIEAVDKEKLLGAILNESSDSADTYNYYRNETAGQRGRKP